MKKLSFFKKMANKMLLNNKYILATFGLMALSINTYAASTSDIMNAVAFGAIISTLILVAIVCLVLLKTFKVMAAMLLPKEELATEAVVIEPAKPKVNIWEKALSLKPLSEEKDMVMNHAYDDIHELNNPIPAWFNWLFYGSVVFGLMYLLNFHVFKLGKLQDEEYVVEMKQAEVDKKAFLAKSADQVDENSVKSSTDAAILAAGQATYKQNCVACHGQNGEGLVGPNLTDEYWLHGSKINNIFKTIKYGVPDKGMISWEKQLSPKQIAEVSNYIESLKGTNPANPKSPQGDKEG